MVDRSLPRGYFGIGIWHPKSDINVGTLWRSAYQFGATFVFTVGRRYQKQASDTTKAWRHIPLFHFEEFQDLLNHTPYNTPIVCIEMGGTPLRAANHPERAVYLLGAEDRGLPERLKYGRQVMSVSAHQDRPQSLNVAVAGAIVMHDRLSKFSRHVGISMSRASMGIERQMRELNGKA